MKRQLDAATDPAPGGCGIRARSCGMARCVDKRSQSRHREAFCVHQLVDRLRALIERLDTENVSGPEFATVAQAASRLGIGSKALRGAIQRGEIPVYHLGTCAAGRPRVHVPEVRAWALGTASDPMAKARAAGDAAARSQRSVSPHQEPRGSK